MEVGFRLVVPRGQRVPGPRGLLDQKVVGLEQEGTLRPLTGDALDASRGQ